MSLDCLSDEIILEIIEYLPVEQRFLLSECSRRLCSIARHDMNSLLGCGVTILSMLLYSIESRPNDTTLSQFILDKHLESSSKNKEWCYWLRSKLPSWNNNLNHVGRIRRRGRWEPSCKDIIPKLYNEAILHNSHRHIFWIEDISGTSFPKYVETCSKLNLLTGKEMFVDEILSKTHDIRPYLTADRGLMMTMIRSGSMIVWDIVVNYFPSWIPLFLIGIVCSKNSIMIEDAIRIIRERKYRIEEYSQYNLLLSALEIGDEHIFHIVSEFVEDFGKKKKKKKKIDGGNRVVPSGVPDNYFVNIVKNENISFMRRIIDDENVPSSGKRRFISMFLKCSLKFGRMKVVMELMNRYEKEIKELTMQEGNSINFINKAIQSGRKKVVEWSLNNFQIVDPSPSSHSSYLLSIRSLCGERRGGAEDIEIVRLLKNHVQTKKFNRYLLLDVPNIQYNALKKGRVDYAIMLGNEMGITKHKFIEVMKKEVRYPYHFISKILHYNKNGTKILEKFFGEEFLMSGERSWMVHFYLGAVSEENVETLKRCIYFGSKYKALPIQIDRLPLARMNSWIQYVLHQIYLREIPLWDNIEDYEKLRKYGYKMMRNDSSNVIELVKTDIVDKIKDHLFSSCLSRKKGKGGHRRYERIVESSSSSL